MGAAQDELLKELRAIRSQYGELNPKVVLEASTPKEAPLHNEFDWNNKTAANAHRLEQAHRLIQSCRIVYRDRTEAEKDVRAFVAIRKPSTHQPDYEPIEDVILDPLKKAIMLQDAERQWRTLKSRFHMLEEFSEMVLRDLNGTDEEAG